MPILYKYCDQLGGLKILAGLELRLPCLTDVNDPHDCWFRFEDEWNKPLPADFEAPRRFALWRANKQCFLISVSETSREPVMWAHYADNHKGLVIGIDFDFIFDRPQGMGLRMTAVEYTTNRPVFSFDEDFVTKESRDRFLIAINTKSSSWSYEKEQRQILSVTDLERFKGLGLARLGLSYDKACWYLKINPGAIKEVVFGLKTEDSLKTAVESIIGKNPSLDSIALRQTKESRTFMLDIDDVGRTTSRGETLGS